MAKIGRNERCPCNSGKKFKHCHGGIFQKNPPDSFPSQDAQKRMQVELTKQNVREYRRRLMQGLGRPIISSENNGYRIVAVANQLRWSKNWRTFHDFLLDYIKEVFTPDWGNAELRKPADERHPLIHWYQKFCEAGKQASKRDGIYSSTMSGCVKAYLSLAYDLYLCAHNAKLLPLLIKRLKNQKDFEGALYETFVIGLFVKAGFSIEMEEEDDSTTAHSEFVATHPETGRKFSVEAKAVTSSSKRSGITSEPPRIRDKLYKALEKELPHNRIVFIELNREQSIDYQGVPDWVPPVDAEMVDAEKTLKIRGVSAPPAYVFVTNRAFWHRPDDPASPETVLAAGFKIDDFAPRGPQTILSMVQGRERHIELHWLVQAAEKHAEIPSSFDDRTPEEAFFQGASIERLEIGSQCQVSDGQGGIINGTVTEAFMIAGQQKAVYAVYFENRTSVLIHKELSDTEFAIYKQSPDTYFGVIKPVTKEVTRPLEAYDFFFESYQHTPREKLLQFMASWTGQAELQKMPQPELARHFCAIYAALMLNAGSYRSTRQPIKPL